MSDPLEMNEYAEFELHDEEILRQISGGDIRVNYWVLYSPILILNPCYESHETVPSGNISITADVRCPSRIPAYPRQTYVTVGGKADAACIQNDLCGSNIPC